MPKPKESVAEQGGSPNRPSSESNAQMLCQRCCGTPRELNAELLGLAPDALLVNDLCFDELSLLNGLSGRSNGDRRLHGPAACRCFGDLYTCEKDSPAG